MTETMTANRTVVGLFDNMDQASKATRELEGAGIDNNQISLVTGNESGKYADSSSGTGEVGKGIAGGAGTGAAVGGGLGLLAGLTALAIPGFGPILAAGPIAAALTGAGVGAAAGGMIGGISNAGVPEDDARYYEEGLKRGGVLVSVSTTEAMAPRASEILDGNGARDIDDRSKDWEQAGWTRPAGYNVRGNDFAASGNEQRSIPVVEEKLKVGKREVSRGGVRVYSHMTETPVEQKVELRDERVRVDRHKVDRPATDADFKAFKEGTIELTETREEAVVSKEARVIEEVMVGKEVGHRTETVRDKVRRTEVKVENTGDYEKDYRTDYQTRYGKSGRDYNYYAPAYQFGSTYANNPSYENRDWTSVQSDVRKDWESKGHGAWEDFKEAVQHGWDRVRGRR